LAVSSTHCRATWIVSEVYEVSVAQPRERRLHFDLFHSSMRKATTRRTAGGGTSVCGRLLRLVVRSFRQLVVSEKRILAAGNRGNRFGPGDADEVVETA